MLVSGSFLASPPGAPDTADFGGFAEWPLAAAGPTAAPALTAVAVSATSARRTCGDMGRRMTVNVPQELSRN